MASIDEMLAMSDVTNGDIRECAERLRDALAAKAALEDVIAALQMELPARMEGDSVAIAGVGVLRKQKYTTSTWADDAASIHFRALVADTAINKVALNVATGELDPTIRQVGRAVVDKLWEYVPSFSTVKAPAKRDGIDVDEFRSFTHTTKVTLDTLDGAPWK